MLRPILCEDCGKPKVVTRDAIGRPRHRCPDCQGVNTTVPAAGTVGHLHRQTATDPHSLAWELEHSATSVVKVQPSRSRTAPLPEIRCRECGAVVPRIAKQGRPRTRCEDPDACRTRARRVGR